MQRLDDKEIPQDTGEIRVFIVGIDAAAIIPYLVEHYFSIGADRIFYIDNNSSDHSVEVLGKYERVHVWNQSVPFDCREQKCGAAWVEALLPTYGAGHWCIFADTDEFFIFPGCERDSLSSFLAEQERLGYNCLYARLIDMYSDRKVKETLLTDHPLVICPYYDRSEFGCRDRVLHFTTFYLKMPVVRFESGMTVSPGFHHIRGPAVRPNPDLQCGLLHFKFLSSISDTIARHGHKMADSADKNAIYGRSGDLNLYDARYSHRYGGSGILDHFQRYDIQGQKRRYKHAKRKELRYRMFHRWRFRWRLAFSASVLGGLFR
ncbi:MAG: hypothetical protein RLY31_184 [Bacteroidota bacterium]|jgi:hypothetical protein